MSALEQNLRKYKSISHIYAKLWCRNDSYFLRTFAVVNYNGFLFSAHDKTKYMFKLQIQFLLLILCWLLNKRFLMWLLVTKTLFICFGRQEKWEEEWVTNKNDEQENPCHTINNHAREIRGSKSPRHCSTQTSFTDYSALSESLLFSSCRAGRWDWLRRTQNLFTIIRLFYLLADSID